MSVPPLRNSWRWYATSLACPVRWFRSRILSVETIRVRCRDIGIRGDDMRSSWRWVGLGVVAILAVALLPMATSVLSQDRVAELE